MNTLTDHAHSERQALIRSAVAPHGPELQLQAHLTFERAKSDKLEAAIRDALTLSYHGCHQQANHVLERALIF
jgi:hypothetical protein